VLNGDAHAKLEMSRRCPPAVCLAVVLFHVVAATQCNLLEEPTHALAVAPLSPGDSTAAGSPAGSTVHVPLLPFQVVSVHLCFTVYIQSGRLSFT
jgi:hypothetical protein